MPFPVDAQTTTLTMTVGQTDGAAVRETITITPSPPQILSTALNDIREGSGAPITITPDRASGTATVRLLNTDATGYSPSGWTYTVQRGSQAPYSISLPASLGSTADLADLTPVPAAPGTYGYLIVATGTPSVGQVPTATSGTTAEWQALPPAGSGTAGVVRLAGDLGGTSASPQVVATHLAAPLPVAQGGTGSTTQTWVDLSTDQTVGGAKTLTGALVLSGGATATVGGYVMADATGSASYTALPKGRVGRSENAGLLIGSSFAGGEDNGAGTDSTGRLNLYSYQRADVGSFGETIRNFAMRADAKTMQAFYIPVQSSDSTGGYDPATRNPKASGVTWQPVAWQGAHYEANSHGSIHGHWELEIPDSTGALQGRLEIPFIDQSKGGGYGASSGQLDGARIGIDYTNIRTNLADFSVRAQNILTGDYAGQTTCLRVGGDNTKVKDIRLSATSDMIASGNRWALRANIDTESGSNAGTNFQLLRYADDGTQLGTALFAQRSDGQLTTGASSAKSARLALVWGTSGIHGFSAQPSASPGSSAAFDAQMTATTDRAIQSQATGDATRRWVAFADGKQEWGDGTNPRDTNLYRSGAGLLATDGSLLVGANLRINTASVGGGTGVVGIANAAVAPTGTPTGGGVLYSAAGQGYWLDSSGVTSALAGPAAVLPSDQGLKSWSFDPVIPTNSSALPGGVVQLVRLQVRAATTITNVLYGVATAATSATTGQCFVALYTSAGTLLSSSADQASAWGSTGLKTTALTTPQTVAAGWYWVAFLFNGTTGPAIYRQQGGLLTMANAGLTSSTARFGSYGTAQTAAPSPITPSSISLTGGITYWCALS
jgi:hypothetical protein